MSSPANRSTSTTSAVLLVFAWLLVGVPLLYGLYQTIKTASTLFTG
jgi:hypothetical protein